MKLFFQCMEHAFGQETTQSPVSHNGHRQERLISIFTQLNLLRMKEGLSVLTHFADATDSVQPNPFNFILVDYGTTVSKLTGMHKTDIGTVAICFRRMNSEPGFAHEDELAIEYYDDITDIHRTSILLTSWGPDDDTANRDAACKLHQLIKKARPTPL